MNELVRTDLGEIMEFARMLARSSMVPKDYQGRPENILVAVQWGREVGLGPLQALQNISVINGRPAIWGDAMLALVRGSSKCAYVNEAVEGEGDTMVASCRCARRDQQGEILGTFSVADAKKANLWGKQGPWTQYPKRMLQMRARGFALRDGFTDVLRGVISVEEARDIPAEPSRPSSDQRARAELLQAADKAHATASEITKAAGEITQAQRTAPAIAPDEIPEPGQLDERPSNLIRKMRDCAAANNPEEYDNLRDAYRDEMKTYTEPDQERVRSEHNRLMKEVFSISQH